MKPIPLFKPYIPPKKDLISSLSSTLYSGQLSEGAQVYEFERKLKLLLKCPNLLAVSSGTAALHLALLSAGVGPGDEVISTPLTAEPTNTAIFQTGAKIVWADVDINNGNISPQSVLSAITEKTKAIMVVDYGGIPVDLDSLPTNIPIIEDAAHAFGAKYDNKMIGNRADFTIFSFQAIKHLNLIDGGLLVSKSEGFIEPARLMRWFGIDRTKDRTTSDIAVLGYKYNMNNLNATIGLEQLKSIKSIIKRYKENGKYFDRALKNIDGIKTLSWSPKAEPSYWFYTLLVDDRDNFSKLLTSYNINNSLVHRRNDLFTLFSASKKPLPNLDYFYSKMIHIPCGWINE